MRSALQRFGSMLLALQVCAPAAAQGLVEFGTPLPIDENAGLGEGDDIDPMLTADGQGTWIAVWWTTEELTGINAGPGETRLARSTDAGATWSEPAPQDTIGAGAGFDRSPTVATDGHGIWLAAWVSFHSLGGTIENDYDLLIAQSVDDGATWSAPAPLNANAGSDAGADLDPALMSDGITTWVAVWESSDSLGGTIGNDYDILVARSIDSGATWSAPTPLNSNAGGDADDDTDAALTTDGQGNWLAVWESRPSNAGRNILAARSTDGGATWSAPIALIQKLGGNFGPRVTTDGQGNWLVVWASNVRFARSVGDDYDIAMVRSINGGATWTAPAALNANAAGDSGDDGLPKVTHDGMGTWLAVWNSTDSLGGRLGRRDFDILTAESTDGGANWTPPAPLNTNAGCDVGDDIDARVATDGQGNWLAVWRSDEPLGSTIGADEDILVARLDPDPTRCQSRDQQACANALNADFAKVARAQDSAIAKCVNNQARKGESATDCLELLNTRLERALSKTRADEVRRCVATLPDFGPLDADTVNEAAVAAEHATLSEVFGPDLDAALAAHVDDASAAKCQKAVLKAVHKCQRTQLKEFNRCKKNALKKGGATSADSLARCLAFDPKGKIAKKCDPLLGPLTTKILPRTCAEADLSAAFPGCDTADPGELASCVDEAVACQVCIGLNEADGLDEDCDLMDDGVENTSCL